MSVLSIFKTRERGSSGNLNRVPERRDASAQFRAFEPEELLAHTGAKLDGKAVGEAADRGIKRSEVGGPFRVIGPGSPVAGVRRVVGTHDSSPFSSISVTFCVNGPHWVRKAARWASPS
ncbi:hypothetical protein GCM10009692_20360 [Leucobacter aridicollis]